MALITMEGFDNLAAATEVGAGLGFYVSSGGGALVTGRWGGQGLQLVNSGVRASFSLPANYTSGFFGMAVQFTGSGLLYIVLQDAGTSQVTVTINTSGLITVNRGDPGGSSFASATAAGWSALAWNYIEIGWVIDPSAGSVIVRVNGVTVLTSTGQNTRSTSDSYANTVYFWPSGSGAFNIDDCYFCDTTGSAPNNTFLGDVRVQTLYPASAGSHTQWTPLTGTNVSQISETHMDSDTSYNSSATAGQIDTFAVTALSGTPAIFGVRVKASARKDDAGTRTVQTRIKSGSTEQGGASYAMTGSYGYIFDVWQTDPNTSAAWTYTGVNAMEIGYECVA